MSFDQSTVQDCQVTREGAELLIAWRTTSPVGTPFQIYRTGDGGAGIKFVWHGRTNRAVIPAPPAGELFQFWVGAVGSSEEFANFASTLTPPWTGRAKITWQGGTYLAPDIASYNIYQSPSPGAAVSYAAPVANIPAYSANLETDGAGYGGAGLGAAGAASASYVWYSGQLAAGTWRFGIKAVDRQGNEGPTSEGSQTISAPPYPPARNAAGQRLTYSYNSSTRVVTLDWLAPGL